MIELTQQGNLNLKTLGGDVLTALGGKVTGKIAGEFSRYLRDKRFDELFAGHARKSKETRKSIGAFRARGKNPSYIIRPGLGIPGSLNYLAGMARGRAVSRSGKAFDYSKKYDLVTGGWNAFGGESKAQTLYEQTVRHWIAEVEAKLEG